MGDFYIVLQVSCGSIRRRSLMRNAIRVGGETLAEDSLLEGGFEDVERYHVGCRSRPGLFLTFSVGLAVFPGILSAGVGLFGAFRLSC